HGVETSSCGRFRLQLIDRLHVDDRLIFVHRPNSIFDRLREPQRITVRAHCKAHAHDRTLIERDIGSSTEITLEAIGALVGNNPHYFPGNVWSQFVLTGYDPLNRYVLTHGVLILEIAFGQSLVNHSDQWGIGAVADGKTAARQNSHTDRLKVFRADDLE